MSVEKELVGQFIDAAVNDPAEALLLLDANPDLRTAHWNLGQTSLHFVAIEGFVDAVGLLLENGFDPNARNQFGDTPLLDVCVLEHVEIAGLLLKHGADPNASSEIRDNPLHCCVEQGSAQLVDMLIVAGADPNYSTEFGATIFDNWPEVAEQQQAMSEVLEKHDVRRAE